ncbi:hypothetical protein [Streptococcus gallolyticus]|uniref:hypothetical protein n=1 Tax=Streptococcus gallolyticus TaxID=315405 RepID=UPI003D6FC735
MIIQNSTHIVVSNLYKYYGQLDKDLVSLNSIAKYINSENLSLNILKNWSSNRSSPSLYQLNELAYYMSVHPSQLLIEDIQFAIDTPIWKDNIIDVFYSNFEKYNEKHLNWSNDFDESLMSYRTYLEILRSRRESISLKKMDIIATILGIKTVSLLEDNN